MFSKLNDSQKCEILLGNWLGDAMYDNRSGFLINRHSSKQNEYVEWLSYLYKNMGVLHSVNFDIPENTNLKNTTISKVIAKVPNKQFFETFYDYSKDTGYTKTGNRTYYKKGIKKIIPWFVSNFRHPMAFLLWYLDDGSLSIKRRFKPDGSLFGVQRHATISTMSFTYDEHLLLQQMFKKINIDVNIYKQKSKDPTTQTLNGNIHNFLYFNANNFRIFFDYVRQYLRLLPKSMCYKFNMQYEVNKRHNSKFLMENYNLA